MSSETDVTDTTAPIDEPDASAIEADADAKTSGEKEPINWLAEIRGLALMLLAVLGFHSFVAKPFYIPSTSMVPNLMVVTGWW